MSAPDRVNDRARKCLQEAADAGHADAMYWITRRGRAEDKESDELLMKAGELGSRGAQRDLGALYATGDWTGPKDPIRGIHWYRLAAERGHDDAQYNVGFMYILGEGTDANVDEGLRWIHRAAMQGNWCARHLLADLYQNGYYGVTKKYRRSQTMGISGIHRRTKTTKKESANPIERTARVVLRLGAILKVGVLKHLKSNQSQVNRAHVAERSRIRLRSRAQPGARPAGVSLTLPASAGNSPTLKPN
jgi:hypothetical protein